MKIHHIVLCLALISSAVHAVMPIKSDEASQLAQDDQVRSAMHALIENASDDINKLNIGAAKKDIEQLKLLEDKTEDKALKAEIDKHVKNLEGSLKFNMKHRHGEIDARKR